MSVSSGRFRHIVLGSGGIGSAAAHWIGRASGGDVLVLEQHTLGHSLGASEDHSRIIRHAYHSADYTALTQASYDTWAQIEADTGVKLVLTTGGINLSCGRESQSRIDSYATALSAQGHAFEILDAGETMRRFPQWRLDPETVTLYQADSGILDIRKANAAHQSLARQSGVQFLQNTPVRRLESKSDRVLVSTDDGVFEAESVSVCAGSWTPEVVSTLGIDLPITLTAEQVTYWSTLRLRDFAPDRFGIWVYNDDLFTFYGFPVYGEVAVKAGRDEPGRVVTQQTRSWEPDVENRAQLTDFMARRLPDALGPELATKTCVYDLTPDRNFLIDFLPGHPRISVFVGAGHAAKFASLAGRIMADLATAGGTDYPIGAFRYSRPAITDPNFQPLIKLLPQPVPVG